MTRIFPPLLALAVASLLAMPAPTRAAEPVAVAPSPAIVLDLVGRILTLFQAEAILVGRSAGGLGYVLLSDKRAFWVRHSPGGLVRIEPADPQQVRAMSRRQGWTI